MSNYIISISREFGSGGRLIGKRLAARLGIPCYDRTIIQKTAEKSGLSPDFIARAEERARSRFHLSIAHSGVGGGNGHHTPVSHQVFFAQADVIRELADQGPCVIVGRCSDYILGDRPECLKVFIHGDLPQRAARCREEYRMADTDLERRIVQMDRGRANYYHYYTGRRWGDMRRYDLTINSGTAGIDGSVELIAALIAARQTRGIAQAQV